MIKNKELKRRIIEISYKLKLGHIGSCLTAVDIIYEIYRTKKRDEKFVLSAGHAHLAHLVVQERMPMTPLWVAKFKDSKDHTTRLAERMIKDYGIHCDRKAGCDASTGSLGHGIGIALGMALADRSKNVYCLLSDGEMAEGSVWEALRIRQELDIKNLIIYINFNGWAAYKETSTRLGNQMYSFLTIWDISDEILSIKETNMDDYPEYLQGQLAHYKILNENEYEKMMEILR